MRQDESETRQDESGGQTWRIHSEGWGMDDTDAVQGKVEGERWGRCYAGRNSRERPKEREGGRIGERQIASI